MNKIFIEAQKPETSEYQFLDTYIKHIGIESSAYKIFCVNGKDNLWNVLPQFEEAEKTDGKNLIIFDADTPANGGGFAKRQEELLNALQTYQVQAHLFLFPNNQDDGMFENLLEQLMLEDKYQSFFDCYNDYESCLGDEYVHPNLKSKVFSYISSMKSLPNSKRKRLGSGKWLFDNTEYWDLEAEYISPLKSFLLDNLT